MSSKTQYKDALKRQKQIVSELKKENEDLKRRLNDLQQMQKRRALIKKPKWYQFWKK